MPKARTTGTLEGLDLDAQNPDMGAEAGHYTKYTDPCKRAAMQSMKCLEVNAHDKSKCHNEFFI